MSALSKPIWNPKHSGLLIRVPLGLYFILAGHMKLQNLEGFIETVRSFNLLPESLAVLYGVLIPWFELVCGIFLVIGIWTTLAAAVAAAMLLTFIYAIGVTPSNPRLFNKDIMVLGAALSLLSCGAGSYSVDEFRKG